MTELKQILCPVDLSEFSRRALDHALAVARCYGSKVTAMHVVAPMPMVVPGPYYFGAKTPPPMALPPADRGMIAAQLQQLADVEQVPSVRVDTLVAEAPVVYSEILVQAERLRSDLVVIVGVIPPDRLVSVLLQEHEEDLSRAARLCDRKCDGDGAARHLRCTRT